MTDEDVGRREREFVQQQAQVAGHVVSRAWKWPAIAFAVSGALVRTDAAFCCKPADHRSPRLDGFPDSHIDHDHRNSAPPDSGVEPPAADVNEFVPLDQR